MSTISEPQFFFVACQRGAENALKAEVAAGPIAARPSFSRPGFVTFKLDDPCKNPKQFQLPSTFARAVSLSIGKVRGEHAAELVELVWEIDEVQALVASGELADLHVWERDREVPGTRGIEPGPTELSRTVEALLRQKSPIEALRSMPDELRPPSRRNRWVLDVAMIEPGEWWIGCHRTTRRTDCWPGGVVPLALPEHAVSRAYLKMQEALHWSALPTTRGQVCIELGCAPGGASQALLDAGLKVVGVDPAEVAPEVLADSNFTHIRRRSVDVPRKALQGAQWLAVDMNVAPTYTLDAVEQIVTDPQASIRGMVLTIKLADLALAAELPKWVERVRSWGHRDVRTRQLAHNRQELCLVALRSRGQRRVHRSSPRRRRFDAAHASKTAGPHLRTDM